MWISLSVYHGFDPLRPSQDKSKISNLVLGVFYFIPDLSGLETNPAGSTRFRNAEEGRVGKRLVKEAIPPPLF
jgi:hypothetical protein